MKRFPFKEWVVPVRISLFLDWHWPLPDRQVHQSPGCSVPHQPSFPALFLPTYAAAPAVDVVPPSPALFVVIALLRELSPPPWLHQTRPVVVSSVHHCVHHSSSPLLSLPLTPAPPPSHVPPASGPLDLWEHHNLQIQTRDSNCVTNSQLFSWDRIPSPYWQVIVIVTDVSKSQVTDS